MRRQILVITVTILVVVTAAGLVTWLASRPATVAKPKPGTLSRFGSDGELVAAFMRGWAGNRMFEGEMMKSSDGTVAPQSLSSEQTEHSTTNVQVAGVDEADLVKNDGRFIYAVSGDSVVIVAAYPPGDARLLSRIIFGEGSSVAELFIEGDALVAIGSAPYRGGGAEDGREIAPRGGVTFIRVYDVSDREKPALKRNIEYEGNYQAARKIGADIHVVLGTSPYWVQHDGEKPEARDIIPVYRDSDREDAGGFTPVCASAQVDCVDPARFTSFLSVVSFSLDGGRETLNRRVVAGYSENVYASIDNLYIASTVYGFQEFWGPEYAGSETTTVFKFSFDGPRTRFVSSADVPGTILNQFSMDESGGYFRVATTLGHVTREGSDSANNVYVLDGELKMVGRLEGLARGERIYSARFMGNRAYLVTFKKVDPFFVLDMADPANPRVLGALKIPGYSDYLHPYDENHVIGVGKNTVEAGAEGDFAWYQGMKVALFDVTDVANPREMHKVFIGDRGTDSYALYDHKAFLFDRERNLLVLPVLLAELTPEQKASPDTRAYDYGEYTFQGAYVYDISLLGGISYRGRISHIDDPSQLAGSYYYYDSSEAVSRSLWIEDYLYTVSEAKVKVHDLATLAPVNSVTLTDR